MYKVIRAKFTPTVECSLDKTSFYDPERVEFSDAIENKPLGNHFIRIENSWIISAISDFANTISIIVCCLSNANKTLQPIIPIQHLGSKFDFAIVLKSGTTNWSVSYIDYNVWAVLYRLGVRSIYRIGKSITIPIQVINNKELNPIIDICNFVQASSRIEENGFKEHYIKYVTYITKPLSTKLLPLGIEPDDVTEMYQPFIIQQNQDGTKSLYFNDRQGIWKLAEQKTTEI